MEFRVVKDEITPFLKRLKTLPTEIGNAGFKTTKLAQRLLRLNLSSKNLMWKGRQGGLWERTRARRLSKFRSIVFIPQYGLFLDSMTPHFVKLKRGRLIRRWAREKGEPHIQQIAQREGSIFVKPHPWIDRPLDLAVKRGTRFIQQAMDKVVR